MTSLSGDMQLEQYAAIGKVANEWSYIDAMLRNYIALVSKIDHELSAKITASLTSTQLYDLYLTILHDGNTGPQSGLYQHVKAARARFNELCGKRNDVIHSNWTCDWLDDAIAVRNRARGTWTSRVQRYSTAEMEALAIDIKGLGDALWQHLLDWEDRWLQLQP